MPCFRPGAGGGSSFGGITLSVSSGPHLAHIHAHQFRRTFARGCALTDSSTGLLALQDHFKHASLAMTRHYAQIDDELLLMFEMEKDRIRAESFDRVLRTEALGGVGGRLIKRKIDTAIELANCHARV